jgi:hypothetical protein
LLLGVLNGLTIAELDAFDELAEVALSRELFDEILQRIDRLQAQSWPLAA